MLRRIFLPLLNGEAATDGYLAIINMKDLK